MGRLAENMVKLYQEIDSGRNQRIDLLNNLKQGRRELSHSVEKMLSDNTHQRMFEYNKVMGGIQNIIEDVKDEIQKRSQAISDLRKDYHHQRDQMRQELLKDSKDDLADRKQFLSNLRHDVTKIRAEARECQKEIQDDLEIIRKTKALKQNLNDSADKKAGTKSRMQPSNDTMKVDIKPIIEPPNKIQKDDFTQIRGIGLERQRLLNNSGIYTFKQFCEKDADFLSDIFGKQTGLNEINKWIEKAKELS
ncbi:MAG: hypothetical protein OMM_04387 [Candidatus Magnetoglobus multicellularis str. Araruama]|uniref:Uncharacterized protein n=1 Tax=Candidatus Magnetoglobus multicellularis str. Araruama TaxID=890399 RepID=A0A1V1P1Q6_9BACT|nr:MAG: hypothetical protein OMM_04387 [Candidatus Magnetoglobus multicellularis str. Araruama]